MNEKTNKRTKKLKERTKNRIVQVVVIVGGVSGRRDFLCHQGGYRDQRGLLARRGAADQAFSTGTLNN